MSTKSAIAWGNGFKLYTELTEKDGSLYLRLDDTYFSASPNQVVIKIPAHVWLTLQKSDPIDLSLIDMTADYIRDMVTKAADSRIAQLEKAKSPLDSNLIALSYAEALGDVDLPRDVQIENGIKYFLDRKQEQLDIIDKCKNHTAYKVFKLADKLVEELEESYGRE